MLIVSDSSRAALDAPFRAAWIDDCTRFLAERPEIAGADVPPDCRAFAVAAHDWGLAKGLREAVDLTRLAYLSLLITPVADSPVDPLAHFGLPAESDALRVLVEHISDELALT